MIDDVAHIAVAFLIGSLFLLGVPLWLVAPLMALPREIEQTVKAIKREGHGWRDHISWDWAKGKARDLLGFAIGGWCAEAAFS